MGVELGFQASRFLVGLCFRLVQFLKRFVWLLVLCKGGSPLQMDLGERQRPQGRTSSTLWTAPERDSPWMGHPEVSQCRGKPCHSSLEELHWTLKPPWSPQMG